MRTVTLSLCTAALCNVPIRISQETGSCYGSDLQLHRGNQLTVLSADVTAQVKRPQRMLTEEADA